MRSKLLLLLVLPLAACVAEPEGLGTGAINCGAIFDVETCQSTAACFPLLCPSCGDTPMFSCEPANQASSCPTIQCPQCRDFDQNECGSAPSCSSQLCYSCDGPYFAICRAPDDPLTICPDFVCPEACSALDEAECNGRPGCHAVYDASSQPICDCAEPGCCTAFDYCADGPANCSDANLGCRQQAPFCEGPFVISYEDTCYEGCVRSEACP